MPDYFADPTSFWASPNRQKEFREKFRVPRVLFDRILAATKESGRWRDTHDSNGHGSPKPLSLACKVASAFRVMAKGAGMDIAEEGSGVSAQVLGRFLPDWLQWFVDENYDKWVPGITTHEELVKVEADFKKIGLPGCVSFSDAVHSHWALCPSAMTSVFTNGKEGEPTISWNVHCSAAGTVLHISSPAKGTTSDKTLVHGDPFAIAMKEDELFSEYEYEVLRRDGTVHTMKGAYSSVDGGYHKWTTLIAAVKTPLTRSEKIYTKRQESARKKVECLFGLLKKRYRILRNGLPYQNITLCDNLLKASCILHNMLMECDGLHDVGQYEDDWENYLIADHELSMYRNVPEFVDPLEPPELDPGYHEKRALLVDHMMVLHERGELYKMKTAEECRAGRRDI